MVTGLDDVVHHQLSPDGHQQVDGLNDQRQRENFTSALLRPVTLLSSFLKCRRFFCTTGVNSLLGHTSKAIPVK